MATTPTPPFTLFSKNDRLRWNPNFRPELGLLGISEKQHTRLTVVEVRSAPVSQGTRTNNEHPQVLKLKDSNGKLFDGFSGSWFLRIDK